MKKENWHKRQVFNNNVGIEATERLVKFCFPGLEVKAVRPPKGKGDIAIPNLRTQFEKANTEWVNPDGTHLYPTFESFIEALEIMIPAKFTEDGIYTNLTYHRWVYTEAVKKATGL